MTASSLSKLRWLKINRYRFIKPGTEFLFADGLNVLIGQNGTGKTTLLDLLAMIWRGNFAEAAHEELDIEYEFQRDAERVRFAIHKNYSDSTRKTRGRKLEQSGPKFNVIISYSTNVTSGQDDCIIKVDANSVRVQYSDGQKKKFEPFDSPFTDGSLFMCLFFHRNKDLFIPWDDMAPFIGRLDEGKTWFEKVLAGASFKIEYDEDLKAVLPPLHERFIANEILEATRKIYNKDRDIEIITYSDAHLKFLKKCVQALGYKQATLNIERTQGDKDSATFGKFRFYFTKRDGKRLPLENLSYGEQRLVAFYYYLAIYKQVLISDELANGMHHSMIASCMEAIDQRQAFLATQDSLVLDHMTFQSAQQVLSSFILCKKEIIEENEVMDMRQMSKEEAEEFFEHYQVGLQHVNAILRMRGLW